MKLILALLRLRLPLEAVLNMRLDRAAGYLDAWSDMQEPRTKGKKFVVMKKMGGKK
jgi:hypothetical protein